MTSNNEMHMPDQTHQEHHNHLGAILGILILALAFIFGGLYLWGGMLHEQNIPTPVPTILNNEPETPRATTDAQILQTLSPSDELDAIDADLSSTNLDSLDTDLTTIDTELNATMTR
jgi:hypothetical protein